MRLVCLWGWMLTLLCFVGYSSQAIRIVLLYLYMTWVSSLLCFTCYCNNTLGIDCGIGNCHENYFFLFLLFGLPPDRWCSPTRYFSKFPCTYWPNGDIALLVMQQLAFSWQMVPTVLCLVSEVNGSWIAVVVVVVVVLELRVFLKSGVGAIFFFSHPPTSPVIYLSRGAHRLFQSFLFNLCAASRMRQAACSSLGLLRQKSEAWSTFGSTGGRGIFFSIAGLTRPSTSVLYSMFSPLHQSDTVLESPPWGSCLSVFATTLSIHWSKLLSTLC